MAQSNVISLAPFFMTHHAPVGAWSSFTFGLPGKGVSINHESAMVENTADFLVAVSRGLGKTKFMPFIFGNWSPDAELRQVSGEKNQPDLSSNNIRERWAIIPPGNIQRTLTTCVDQYVSGGLELRVFTPHAAMPDPDREIREAFVRESKFACCPGILLELTVDNRTYDQPAYGFLGLIYLSRGRIRPLDWTTEDRMSGIAFSGSWALAARTIPGEVFTVRDNSIAANVEAGEKVVHNGGQEGGILFIVPPGEARTFQAAFGFYHEGTATQGIESRYYYCRYFNRVEEVCGYILDHAAEIKQRSHEFDAMVESGAPAEPLDLSKYRLFGQAIRAYYANSQLTEAGGKIYYNLCEGQYLWRNTMDLAADHLPFELWRNPWVVRNIMDLFIERYSYHDKLRFDGQPGEIFPGGRSFTHDMGNYTSFTPPGISGYEKSDAVSYHFMTTEELLNGIFCLTSYAIATRELGWMEKRKPIALELLSSMENRDHYLCGKRNGILKGASLQCGERGREITTYDALDHSLLDAAGNLYITVKTLCSAILLHEYFMIIADLESAARAQEMAGKTAKGLESFFDVTRSCFKANIYHESESKVIAAIEPFAVPLFIGLKERVLRYGAVMELFWKHIKSCLQNGDCLDGATGGLRLSSTSTNTWVSKSILCEFVMAELFTMDVAADYPTILRELVHWATISAQELTISDQIQSDTRTVVGASYYPRAITASLWIQQSYLPQAKKSWI
jgi:hypothetical protein